MTTLSIECMLISTRSAALMLEREVASQKRLDPRLEERISPTGQKFYYGARDLVFVREPRLYDTVRGGILAETMGLGKTLMCIALVLATKDHYPRAPAQYKLPLPICPQNAASLVDMTAAALARYSIPWRKAFDDHHERTGEELTSCIKIMEEQKSYYEIPPTPIRYSRSSTFATPPERIRLCKTTIIVVPRNLIHQWQLEINKHVESDYLKLLVMEDTKIALPTPDQLTRFDIILFSRPRFEFENKDRGDELYESPLKQLHFLRIIIDEGHSFATANTNASIVADRLVRAERRWIISGTPAKDLMGVEVDMDALTREGDPEDAKLFRKESLEERKSFSLSQESQSGAIKSFGVLASRFLKAQPWAISSHGAFQEAAKWDDYVYTYESNGATRTLSGFTSCLRRTLETLVIKTQPDDVERDIDLPPLHHKIVRLKPCLFDKLTANLFVFLFTSNAITSERKDQDYLFHPGSKQHLQRLIATLRQSPFFWTGNKEEAITASLGVIERYLAKEDTQCTWQDRSTLKEIVAAAKTALASPAWRIMSESEEMGVFVQNFPAHVVDTCAFSGCRDPVLMSLTEVYESMKWVDSHLAEDDPTSGLVDARIAAHAAVAAAKAEVLEALQKRAPKKAKKETALQMVKSGVPLSSFDHSNKRLPVSGAASSPRKTPKKKTEDQSDHTVAKDTVTSTISPEKHAPKRKPRQRLSTGDKTIDLEPTSPLGRTALVGTVSSKLTYLISSVLACYRTEKILIFYSGDHIAWYLSQALDLFSIKHLIYANLMSGSTRSKYIVLFDTDPGHRVLLMDVKQAAHGLNLSSASRVFFVNPIYSPALEAQAIKRAHRIGQTKPVFVETLVLEGTVEEAMLERSTNMTRDEHGRAAKSLTDDWGMAQIIQNARCLPVSEDETTGLGQMSKLDVSQQIFGRPGRNGGEETGLEKELFGAVDQKPRREDLLVEANRDDTPTSKKGKRKRAHNIDLDMEEDREDSVAMESHIKREPEDTPIPVKKGKGKNKANADVELNAAAEDGEGSTATKHKKARQSKKTKAATAAADVPDAQYSAASTTFPASVAAETIGIYAPQPILADDDVASAMMDTSEPTPIASHSNVAVSSIITNVITSPSPATSTAGYTSIFDATMPDTDTPIASIFSTPLTSDPTTSTRQGYSSIFGGG